MSRSLNALTPKNLANKTIEDLIDNLTLQSLDLSNGTLNLTGTTVIGASALIPDPLNITTLNSTDVNTTNLDVENIENTNGTPLSITNNLNLITIDSTNAFGVAITNNLNPPGTIVSVGSLDIVLNVPQFGSIFLRTPSITTFFQSEYVGISTYNRGSTAPNNLIPTNFADNTNQLQRTMRTVNGSFLINVPIPGGGNIAQAINIGGGGGLAFTGPPIVICTALFNGIQPINVNTISITTNNFNVRVANLGGAAANNVIIQWIAMGIVL